MKVSLAFLVGGKTAALEPLAVLAVSFLASHSIISHAFRRKVDDTLVSAEMEHRRLSYAHIFLLHALAVVYTRTIV